MTIGISKADLECRLKMNLEFYDADDPTILTLKWLIDNCEELDLWLTVGENTPKDRRILFFYPSGISYIGMACEGGYYPIETLIRMEPEQPTHWQKLPENPT